MRPCTTVNWGLVVSLCLTLTSAQQTADDDDYYHFVTEPNFRANKVTVTTSVQDKSLLEPGYVFFAPFPDRGNPLNGPQIVDQDGGLIWYGNATTKARVQDFHVCRYLEDSPTHLCWSESEFTTIGHVRGSNRLFDNTYTQVGRDYGSSQPLRFPDPHEFNTFSMGKTFAHSVFQLRNVDLSSYGGQRDGYILDGCFQEIDFLTGVAAFTWCGSEHLELWQSYVYFEKAVNDTGEHFGKGTLHSPWDFFHLNAIDKNEEGDYFVSARHLDQILKIAGNNNVHGVAPGTILWRLGGKANQFANNDLVDLSRQHHIRHHKTTKNETTLSFFNNQWFQKNGTHGVSNAQIIVVNNHSMSVTDVRKFYHPEGQLAAAQGSSQVLSNENTFVGWGFIPHVSEFSPNGTLLYHAQLAKYAQGHSGQVNYRAFKFPWSGKPISKPKLVSYSLGCEPGPATPITAYASWNGATDVHFWRFQTSQTSKQGPWQAAGTFARTGFETRANLQDMFGAPALFARYVKAEALDAHYNVLSETAAATFVPGAAVETQCDADGCFGLEGFEYGPELSVAQTCAVHEDACLPIVALVVLLCALEYVIFFNWKAITSLFARRSWLSEGYIQVDVEEDVMEKV